MEFFSFQMHHPIQMKPADSENRNGELHCIFSAEAEREGAFEAPAVGSLHLPDFGVIELSRSEKLPRN